MFRRNRRRRGHRNRNSRRGSTTNNQRGTESDVPKGQDHILDEQRQSRLISSLMCSLYRHLDGDTQTPIRQRKAVSEIRNILSVYRDVTQNARPVSVASNQAFKDFVVYSSAYLCYNWRLENSIVISKILINMYKNCGHFMILFQKSLPHPVRDFGWIGPLAMMNRQTRAPTIGSCPFSYFAHHANKAKITFRWIRFVDLRLVHPNGFRPSPVYLSASLGEYELLRFLLQLGADLGDRREHSQQLHDRPPWVASLIDKLLSNALRSGALTLMETQLSGHDNGCSEILCIRLLLRAVSHLNIEWLEFRRNSYWKSIFSTAEEMVLSLCEKGLLPSFPQRCLEPAELKHLCRITIRNRLRQNWQLPEGVFKLEIPKILEAYVNLDHD